MTDRQPSDYERAIQENAQLRLENRELKQRLNSSRQYYRRVAHLWKTRYMRLRDETPCPSLARKRPAPKNVFLSDPDLRRIIEMTPRA